MQRTIQVTFALGLCQGYPRAEAFFVLQSDRSGTGRKSELVCIAPKGLLDRSMCTQA